MKTIPIGKVAFCLFHTDCIVVNSEICYVLELIWVIIWITNHANLLTIAYVLLISLHDYNMCQMFDIITIRFLGNI